MKLTIRAKLLIGFTILLVLSSSIIAVAFLITKQYISSQIDVFQTDQVDKGTTAVTDFFSTVNLDNFGLASLLGSQYDTAGTFSKSEIALLMNYILKSKNYLNEITILSPVGKELLTYNTSGLKSENTLNYEIQSEPFQSAVMGTSSLSKVYFIETDTGPYVDMYSPIFGKDGAVVGIIKTQVKLTQLQQAINIIKLGQNGSLYVVDDEGRLISHKTDSFLATRPNLGSRPLIHDILQGISVSKNNERYINENDIDVVGKAGRIPGYNWVVVFEQPVEDAYGFLNFLATMFLGTLVGSMAFLLLISYILSENLTRSIRKLEQSASLLEQGKLVTNIDIKSGDEIETLSHSFSTMVNRLVQREQSLQHEKQETETLLQSLTDGVISVDQQGKIITFNKAAEKVTGFSVAEVLGKNVDEILQFYHTQELVPFVTYSQQTDDMRKKLRDEGLHLSTKEGQKVSLSLTTSPVIFSDQKNGFIISFHDISKEQELEEMKLDFVSMAAHELRTPLTAIRGYASLLQLQNANQLDDAGKELIKRLVVSGETLGNLIENLLSVSRIERSMFTVDARPVDLTTTIKNVVDNVRPQANTKKQTVNILVPDQLPIVNADSFRIGQVVLNLVANAVNYTQPGGTITLKAEQKDNNVQISVSDTGQGIPPDALQKLFTKFFRVSGKLEKGSKGTGLGLYISKSIIEMHKGKIWVESTVGTGTTFSFTLPIATPSEIAAFQQKHDLTAKNGHVIMGKKL
ncbi:MAG TPA: ATP-binding protein [Patescibacteria group bacterium]|nr:ATP-binding protein [Patescibacteria group bacterium]